jgi:hypothetical protein
LVEAGGNAAVIDRFTRELPSASAADPDVWNEIRAFMPRFLAENPQGGIATMAMKLTEMPDAMAKLTVPAIARAGSGVIYAHYPENATPASWNGDFATMERIKTMFDPDRLLNRGRLYDRI